MTEIDLLIKSAGELLTLSTSFQDESGLGIIRKGAVGIRESRIVWVGQDGWTSEGGLFKSRRP